MSAKKEYQLVTQLFRNGTLGKLRQTTDSIELLTLELGKNEERQQASVTRAPVSGRVRQLKVCTEGGAVTTAETPTVIVPEDDTLEVTALVQNRNIGFINIGQNAIIKMEVFPYARYGYLMGEVKDISLDTIGGQRLGLVFNVIVSIEENNLSTGNKRIPLNSGVAVTAEIRIGI